MTQNDYVQNLARDLDLLSKALGWLRRSYGICSGIGFKASYTEEEHDAIETLTSRYARTTDMIIQKVFRSIDKVELEDSGTMIDVVNRADKRGLFQSVDEIRALKDLRNKIAHEYAKGDLDDLYVEVVDFIPKIFSISDAIFEYCSRYQKR